MKTRIAQVIKVLSIMALVAAFAAAAFPAPSFAAAGRIETEGKAVIKVVTAKSSSEDTFQPVADATVELVNSTGVAVAKYATDTTGTIRLSLKLPIYKIRVLATGFDAAGDYLTIKNGQTTNLTVQLYPASTTPAAGSTLVPAGVPATSSGSGYGKAVINVVTASSGPAGGLQPVADAIIDVIDAKGVTVAKYATDSNGQANLGIFEGEYKINVSAKGFDPAGDYLTIKDGQTTYVTVQLYPVSSAPVPGPILVVDADPTPISGR